MVYRVADLSHLCPTQTPHPTDGMREHPFEAFRNLVRNLVGVAPVSRLARAQAALTREQHVDTRGDAAPEWAQLAYAEGARRGDEVPRGRAGGAQDRA